MDRKILEENVISLNKKGFTDIQIAKKLNVKFQAVNYIRNKYNLPLYVKYTNKDEEKILNLFRSGLLMSQIKKRTNISSWKIRDVLHKHGLNGYNWYLKKHNNKFGPRELSIICGILLGDGTLYTSYNTTRFVVRHCMSQKQYNEYIYYCLKSLNPKIFQLKLKESIINGKTLKSSYQTEVRIISNTVLNELKKQFYVNDRKIIPFELLKKYYTAESLAFHFMDDGSKCYDSNGKINGFVISTNSFTYEEVNNFKFFLLGKFGIDSTIYTQNNKPILRIKSNSVNRFIKIVKPYIIDSMLYKISPNKIS